MLKVLFLSTYYQVLIFLRIRQAVFFSIAFPAFLFVVFGNIWGLKNSEYISFLLSGVIAMTIASDGLFAIGPVIREYYSNGLIKYLKKLPFNILLHFVGLIISRLLTLFFVVLLLCVIAYVVFGYHVSFVDVVNFLVGTLVGLFVFSFLGLVLAFSGIKQGSDRGIVNFVYFCMLFTSSAFYPIDNFNRFLGAIGNFLPLNHVLLILRKGEFSYALLFWVLFLSVLFFVLLNRIKFDK